MTEILSAIFILLGVLFSLVAALGVIRMPDLYMRMAAATKAGTLGAGLILVAVAIHFANIEATTKVLAAIGFFLLTAPIGAHMIGRAAYVIKVPKWKGTVRDDLKGRCDVAGDIIKSGFEKKS